MSENDNNGKGDGIPIVGDPVAEPITILISYDRTTGSLQLQGPIQDRVLCYGILESAKEAVLKAGLQEQPRGGRIALPFMRR